jgi:hypothetical protein
MKNIIKGLKSAGAVNEWTHPKTGEVRYYLDIAQLPFVEIERYNSGNISSMRVDGEKVSNSQGAQVLGFKTWIDEKGEFHTQSRMILTTPPLLDEIIEKVKKSYA